MTKSANPATVYVKTKAGTLLRKLPDRMFLRVMFLLKTKRVLRLNHPQTYSEKMQWMKVYGGLERYTNLVDKYEVREFVARIIGEQYLVPLLGVWDSFDEIDFDALPDRFALKGTHGSGFNFICRDKSAIDYDKLRTQVNGWMSENFFTYGREPQYKGCQPRIIAEQYIEDETGEIRDYKFPSFDGEPQIALVIGNRLKGTTEDVYDLDWVRLPVHEKGYPHTPGNMPKPLQLKEMIEVSRKLAQGFPFVRVDLYIANNKVYFGELTFTPASGIISYDPESFDLTLGQMIPVPFARAATR